MSTTQAHPPLEQRTYTKEELLDLHNSGYTSVELQQASGRSASTIRRWKTERKHALGEAAERYALVRDPEPEPTEEDLAAQVEALAKALRDADRGKARALAEKKVAVAQLREAEAELKELEGITQLVYGLDDAERHPPEWLSPKHDRAGKRVAHVNLVLSDLHLDEVVKAANVSGVNAFNRAIAVQRLKRTIEKAVVLPRDYLAGITYDGIVIHLAGDTFSGDIHEELARSNEVTPLESVHDWLDIFVAAIRLLADEYGRVHIVSVPGNHDRTTRKPIHKGRVETSMHYLFSRLLERDFRGDDRVSFHIPRSPDALTTQYGTTILTTHGDQFRGGNGIGGILVPILRGDSRKRQRQQAVRQPYDLLVMGHFHQYISGPGVLLNGSLKGYDEYAYNNNFAFEEPQQALFLVTPEHGPSFHMPIKCQSKDEVWDGVLAAAA